MTDALKYIEKLSEDKKEFLVLVGTILTEWAEVDEELFRLVQYALNTTPEKTAIVFYATDSIKSHLVTCDKLLYRSLPTVMLKQWLEISSLFDSLLPIRNNIAHNPLTAIAEVWGAELHESGETIVLADRHYWTIRTSPYKMLKPNEKERRTTKKELKDHISRLREALQKAYAFRLTLPEKPLDQPEPYSIKNTK